MLGVSNIPSERLLRWSAEPATADRPTFPPSGSPQGKPCQPRRTLRTSAWNANAARIVRRQNRVSNAENPPAIGLLRPPGVQFRDSLLSGENSTRRWPRCHLFGRDSLGKGSVVCSPGPRSRRGSTGTPGSRRTPHPRTPTSAYLVGSGPRIVPPHGHIPVDPQLTTWRILPPKRIKLREEDSVALPADLGEFVRGFRVRLEAEACLVGRPFD